MAVYDLAHKLAKGLRDSEEYRKYSELREKVLQDEPTLKLAQEYQELGFKMQTTKLMGQEVKEEEEERLKKLEELVGLNATIQSYIKAESQIGIMLQDIQRILTQSLDLGLDSEKERSQ